MMPCINSLNQTNIIDDSVWQSCIFEGLFFEWFKAVIFYPNTQLFFMQSEGFTPSPV